MNTQALKLKRRIRRKLNIKKRIKGSAERPRLTIYRSLNEIYAQVINDVDGTTIAFASSIDKELKDSIKPGIKKVEKSKMVGHLIARRAIEKNVKNVAFDRNGYLYHGRVKLFADAARESGLVF